MKASSRFDWPGFFSLLLGAALVVVAWQTWFIYPLKLLVVFFHELSHGLAALATGGAIERIEMVAAQGGLCVTRGGSRFLVLVAGYLGSMLWGALLLVLAARTDLDRALTVLLGLLMTAVALLWVRPLIGFGFAFCVLGGVLLVAAGATLPRGVNDAVLKLIGLVSCLYAVPDVVSDVLVRRHLRSDAVLLAELTGVPALAWGVLWIVASLAVGFAALALACRRKVAAHEPA